MPMGEGQESGGENILMQSNFITRVVLTPGGKFEGRNGQIIGERGGEKESPSPRYLHHNTKGKGEHDGSPGGLKSFGRKVR